jgi:hypothetical protein
MKINVLENVYEVVSRDLWGGNMGDEGVERNL